MARGNHALLVALLALIFVVQFVAAYGVQRPLDNDHSGSDNRSGSDDKKGGRNDKRSGSDDKERSGSSGSNGDSSSRDSDDGSKYKRMTAVLYENLNVNSNYTTFGSGVGQDLMYSTPLYKSKAFTNKVGQHYLYATIMWNDMLMVQCSLNLGNGVITATGAFKWTEKVGRLAVTGTTGAYVGYSGTAFMYAMDASSVKDSTRHQLVLKVFKVSS